MIYIPTLFLAHYLSYSKKRYRKYYDQKMKIRKFKRGEQVLILLPTNIKKLLMQWEGPFVVTGVLTQNNYKLRVPGKEKHIMPTC